jgi:hypothetical protein
MNAKQLREQLDAIHSSTSWKITAPLRIVGRIIKPGRSLNISIKSFVVGLLRRLISQPTLLRLGTRVLAYFPKTQRKIRQLLLTSRQAQSNNGSVRSKFSTGEADIGSDAKVILCRIRIIIDANDRQF